MLTFAPTHAISPRVQQAKGFVNVREPVVLLTEHDAPHQNGCIAKVLDFFGVASRNLTEAEARTDSPDAGVLEQARVLCSADVFLRMIENVERNPESMPAWWGRLHSAFVYAGEDPELLQMLARVLAGDAGAVLREIDSGAEELEVTDDLRSFCGVMSGVRATVPKAEIAASLLLHASGANTINVISAGRGATFLKMQYKGIPVFLSTCNRIIDIDAKLAAANFDVRNYFLSAVPLVLYINWAFPQTRWETPETNACLVIDDPLLKPSYGFLNFEALLALMERHYFSTNVAFIPWNWRRSNAKVAALFNREAEHYSLSIHGCDHTAGEFGGHDRERLYGKARKAIDRMSDHQTRTGIHYERIMVFPQGIFSETALDVLKRLNFIAAVNTRAVSSSPRKKETITIGDSWDVATLHRGGFPIFTRRYPSAGIENFAFDILLGKPCLVAIHHDFCRDRYKHLLGLIDRLNALNGSLSWRGLGEVVRRSYRQRKLAPGVREIRMYGTELQLENRSGQQERDLVRRRECEPSAVKEIRDESGPGTWSSTNGCVDFEIELDSDQRKTVGITFHELAGNGSVGESLFDRGKTMVRRYLSEVRDNYVVKSKWHFSALFR